MRPSRVHERFMVAGGYLQCDAKRRFGLGWRRYGDPMPIGNMSLSGLYFSGWGKPPRPDSRCRLTLHVPGFEPFALIARVVRTDTGSNSQESGAPVAHQWGCAVEFADIDAQTWAQLRAVEARAAVAEVKSPNRTPSPPAKSPPVRGLHFARELKHLVKARPECTATLTHD